MSGFTVIKNELVKNKNVSRSARLFAIELSSRCYGDKDSCFPSQKTLAEDMGVSVRTIQRWVKILKEAGIIKVVRRGFNQTNEYTMLLKQKLNKSVAQVKCAATKAKTAYHKYKKRNFNNYNQRTYDFEDLEKKLLGWT